MDFRIILFFIIIIFGILSGSGEDPQGKKRKWYVIIIISLLILESCLRSVTVGPDTMEYYRMFRFTEKTTWHEIWTSFREAYIEGEGKDPGYTLFVKTVQLFSNNFNVFLFVSALVFFIPLGIVLYRYSTHILQLVFAFTLYVALFNVVALSGIRQQIATGFTFMALLQLGKDKYFKSLLLIGIGALIHISALVFLLVVLIKLFLMKIVKPIHLLSFVTIPFGIVFAGQIMIYLASFLANDYYSAYGESVSSGGAVLYVVLMELLSLFCFIAFKKETINNDKTVSSFYPMLPLLTITVPLISLDGAMIRVGQYFTLYFMLLVPIAVDYMVKDSYRKFFYWFMIAILIVLSIRSGDFNYHFFWQEAQIY